MKFSEKVGDEPMNKRLNFGGDPVHGSGLESISVSRFATLVRRALEGCTVPVLLVLFIVEMLHKSEKSP